MKLHFAPGACSVGIHVLLEEIGKPYETARVDLRAGDQFKPEFTAVNPKSKVPTLERDDGSVLTEYPAIAYWLAASNPDAGLLPTDPDAVARAIEGTDYCVSTLHMQAFSRLFRPDKYAPTATDHDAVKQEGAAMFEKGLHVMEGKLGGNEWVAGDYSFADSALFYVSFWWNGRLKHDLPPGIAAHYARMNARPAVQRTLAAEGLA